MAALLWVTCASCSPAPSGESQPAPPGATSAFTPIAWGSQACDSCRMSIDAPAHATQAIADDGRVLSFDDPGCLVIEIGMGRLRPGEIRFRHVDEDRWLALDEAGFARREGTPMSFGYVAVDREHAALDFPQVVVEMTERFQLAPP
jgi:hypothetical protein